MISRGGCSPVTINVFLKISRLHLSILILGIECYVQEDLTHSADMNIPLISKHFLDILFYVCQKSTKAVCLNTRYFLTLFLKIQGICKGTQQQFSLMEQFNLETFEQIILRPVYTQ